MNGIWYNQATLYFNFCRNSGTFCKEFVFIKKELGKIPPYKPIQKKDNI